MRKAIATAAIVAMSLVGLRADVTVVQTMSMEGAAAAAMGGAALPRLTIRIKGQKARSDVDMNGQTISSIADLTKKQLVLLNTASKAARIVTAESPAGAAMPDVDFTYKATGKTRTIEGQVCDEFALTMKLNMADLLPQGQATPEMAAMMADVFMVLNGSIWIAKGAPGASEFAAFNKAALDSNLMNAITGVGGQGPIGKLLEANATAPGLPYLTEITMQVEGSGPMVEGLKQMGPLKMVQKITSVSTEALDDAIFEIPKDYKVEK